MKTLLSLFLVALLCLSLLCGCEVEPPLTPAETTAADVTVPVTEVQADYEEVYAETLDGVYDLISTDDELSFTAAGHIGVREAIAGLDKEQALEAVGYTFKDLTGDGFSELIIGSVGSGEGVKAPIFAVYTIAHDMSFVILEGMARSSYILLDDGTFLYEGSGGAAYSGIGNYRMSQGGTSLICNEFYFTEPDDKDPGTLYIYKNTSGKWDKEKSEKTELTLDDFDKIREDLEAKIVSLELTPFSQYK